MDTIVAIATPPIPSAIGILRVSGKDALSIADKICRPCDGKNLSSHTPRSMVYGDFLSSDGSVLDRGLAVFFTAPNSYTGENSVEMYCHGSPIICGELLSSLCHHGARLATAGEYTKRAFLSGKLDLSQAEAVIDLIESESVAAAKNALSQLDGVLGQRLDGVYEDLLAMSARFYAIVDYPDEDIEEMELVKWQEILRVSRTILSQLADSYVRGQMIKEGIPTVILGRPNAGKSSLLNAMLGSDRAIVTDIPGTTRDTLEEKVRLGDMLLRLIDTAGIRETTDTVEQMGVELAKKAALSAALSLLLLDGSTAITEEDEIALNIAKKCDKSIVILNKSDITRLEYYQNRFPDGIIISAKEGDGLSNLTARITELFPNPVASHGDTCLTNFRQTQSVRDGIRAIDNAIFALDSGLTPDAILVDVEDALRAIGNVTGRKMKDDMVEHIFSRFCVGK